MNKVIHTDFLGHDASVLGFGTMRLAMKDGMIDQNHVNDMVKYALDCGVNYFDTSFVYHDGESETALGIALEGVERSSYLLADKMSFWTVKYAEDLDSVLDNQLKKLKTDYIDFYLLHSLDEGNWDIVKRYDGIKWALAKKKEGKIRHLGFSIHADYDLLLEIIDAYDFEFAQIQYNYIDRDDNPGWRGYDELVRRNIPITVMEPLKGGILTDLNDETAAPYRTLGRSNADMAFRWIAEKKGIAVILSGMSHMEQLESNIEIFSNLAPLTENEHNAVKSVTKNILNAQKINCTGCRYCMPCPQGIDVPSLFRAWNTAAMKYGTNWVNGDFVDKSEAEKCIQCGQCAVHCPQKIDIPSMLVRLRDEN